MTTNEIKTLIQNTIAGQGSQVDIGGKLAEILGAIVDAIPSGEMPRPIQMTSAPEEEDTIETLAEKGLTVEEIQAAARGERTGVIINTECFSILSVYYLGNGAGGIVFAVFQFNGNGGAVALSQYEIRIDSDGATIIIKEI